MPNYETMIILKPDLEAEAEEELIANLQSTIMKKGRTVDSVDDWGKRKLAYEINKFKEGHYYLPHTLPVRRRLHLNLSIFTGLTMK